MELMKFMVDLLMVFIGCLCIAVIIKLSRNRKMRASKNLSSEETRKEPSKQPNISKRVNSIHNGRSGSTTRTNSPEPVYTRSDINTSTNIASAALLYTTTENSYAGSHDSNYSSHNHSKNEDSSYGSHGHTNNHDSSYSSHGHSSSDSGSLSSGSSSGGDYNSGDGGGGSVDF